MLNYSSHRTQFNLWIAPHKSFVTAWSFAKDKQHIWRITYVFILYKGNENTQFQKQENRSSLFNFDFYRKSSMYTGQKNYSLFLLFPAQESKIYTSLDTNNA